MRSGILDAKQSRLGLRRYERRGERRASISVSGRVFCAVRAREFPCILLDISPVGAALECAGYLSAEDKIIFYLERLGRFEGTIVARAGIRLSVKFAKSEFSRTKIASKIAHFLETVDDDGSRLRTAPRAPKHAMSQFMWRDGSVSDCSIIDISLTGASLATQARPRLGDVIHFGTTPARVVRHHASGIGVEFIPRSEFLSRSV